MKKITAILCGISMMMVASGCCCWPGHSSYYGGCPGGNCGVGSPTVIPQGAYYNSTQSKQTAIPASSTSEPVAITTPVYTTGYSPTVMIDPLPTY